jgi:hypothetical protein
MVRPLPGQAAPIAPRNAIVVLDVRPSFTWFAAAGTPTYTVQIQQVDGADARPARFEAGQDTTWSYPAAAPALLPGATYRWTVAANGRAAEPQTFRVVSGAEFATLAQALAELAESGVDPLTDGLYVTALRYRDAGLFYEADRALARLAENGSGTGRAFHLLRGEVFDRMGLLELAAAAFRAADREPGS